MSCDYYETTLVVQNNQEEPYDDHKHSIYFLRTVEKILLNCKVSNTMLVSIVQFYHATRLGFFRGVRVLANILFGDRQTFVWRAQLCSTKCTNFCVIKIFPPINGRKQKIHRSIDSLIFSGKDTHNGTLLPRHGFWSCPWCFCQYSSHSCLWHDPFTAVRTILGLDRRGAVVVESPRIEIIILATPHRSSFRSFIVRARPCDAFFGNSTRWRIYNKVP